MDPKGFNRSSLESVSEGGGGCMDELLVLRARF